MYKKLNVAEVKSGELVKYDPFNEEIEFEAITDPLQRENAETVGYYAMFELNYGLTKKMYWSKERMLNHAKKFSKAFNSPSSYWQKDFDAMAKKTMLRQLISKWGYMSTEMQMAFESDGSKNYVDNPSVADAFTPQEGAIEVPQEQIQEEEPF
jgi:recombination protein RecT